MTRWSAAALLGGIVAAVCWTPAAVASPPSGSAELFVITDPRITEASGLALSGRHEGVLWTHNDSGGEPQLFGLGFDGSVVAVATLDDATNIDWEGLATGPDGTLWVGDIGDNDVSREEIEVYRVSEPDLGDTHVTATKFVFRYPDGPHDAEGLLINPHTGRLWIATKQIWCGGLYEAPEQLSTDGINQLSRLRNVPSVVTDGTWFPDGDRYVLRSYGRAWIYDTGGNPLAQVELPGQDQGQNQGESIAFSPTGTLLSGSEQPNSTIWEIPVSGSEPPTAGAWGCEGADGTAAGAGAATGESQATTDPAPGAASDEGGIITQPEDQTAQDGGGSSGVAFAVAAAIATIFLVWWSRRKRGT